eukprot:CAMPEP_0116011846 /NCGR_PEP_ID=MMETSP0321-20121206/4795_1 /TAXON_ID=163516 /ORGANISM="Leptocylindrus danicus var. danicus, Strain B650" /LENGTH=766 /DNA_ID=CAMNT_0003481125 /DNA_START=108 /DNA_END=2408 /DNA_ORIENTATION=+
MDNISTTTTTTNAQSEITVRESRAAVVFGASSEQGRAVIEGLVDAGFGKIYGVTSHLTYASRLLARYKHEHHILKNRVYLLECGGGALSNPQQVKQVLSETQARYIFLVTATDLPRHAHTEGCREAENMEYDAIRSFFDVLVEVYKEDGLERNVVFSSHEDVRAMCMLDNHPAAAAAAAGERLSIPPLEDGSVVPNFSGKGRGAEYGLQLLSDYPDLTLSIITLPFLYSNFLALCCPLPDKGRTEWQISACLGDDAIDMFSEHDLSFIVPEIFENPSIYSQCNLKLTAGAARLNDIAESFSAFFGKDVIYNPLTYQEMANLSIPTAACMAQMCHFFASCGGSTPSYSKDVAESLMLPTLRRPQTFEEWLLVHGNAREFQEVGLTAKAVPIISVCVFDADTVEGINVAESLLKNDNIRSVTAVFSDFDSEPARRLYAIDPERVRLASISETRDEKSLKKLLEGIDGVFMIIDVSDAGILHRDEGEELHAINVIDACEMCSVRHIIFCTTESIVEMQHELKWPSSDDEKAGDDESSFKSTKLSKPLRSITQIEAYLHEQLQKHPQKVFIDAKARIAAYAKSERITVTFVILPLYPENFFDLVTKAGVVTNNVDDAAMHFAPEKEESLLACMSVQDLGRAVARIFDFYEEYAGHEIGLATDFITIREVAQVVREIFFESRIDNKDDTSANDTNRIVQIQHVHDQMQVEGTGNRIIDLGAIFGFCSQSDAVRKRHSIAKVLNLCPEPTTFKMWMNENKYNPAFREKLGLR